MDLIRTMLVYMMLVVGSAAEASPAMTPPPVEAVPSMNPQAVATLAPSAVPTVTPTPAPTAKPTSYTTLYVGDRGEEVRKLQRRLTELNYLNDKIDGVYGQKTKRAVERFQLYNNLTVDGIAGKATQKALYENPNVVTAPPDITPGPTPAPAPRSVNVPVYYVDQDGLLLVRDNVTCYTTTTIYANSSKVGSNYALISSGTATVTVVNGVASPASVTFRYQYQPTPTAVPSMIKVPVYYMTDTGMILHQTTANIVRNTTSYVTVNTSLVPATYTLTSAPSVTVTVNNQGIASPASVVFTFRGSSPIASPASQRAQVPVRYVNENGFLLNETTLSIPYGTTQAVYANANMVSSANYRLVSQNPVTVNISSQGAATPAVVIFTYKYITPTQAPTATPTPAPVTVPVYYMTTTGTLLAQTTVTVARNAMLRVPVDFGLVPANYTLTSASPVMVSVNSLGIATPASITFTFRAPAPTAAPTQRPTATPAPSLVKVPVYYTTETGTLLYQTTVNIARNTSSYVPVDRALAPSGYTLISASPVVVTVNSYGVASPASVTFTFRAPAPTATPRPTETPVPVPAMAKVPVYYMTNTGVLLYQTTVNVARNTDSYVTVDYSLAPSGYSLVSAPTVTVSVNSQAVASPASVTFTFRAPQPTATPTPTQRPTDTPVPVPAMAKVPVYYMTNTGVLLYQTTANIARNTTSYVPVDTGLVPPTYTLISVSPVAVTVDSQANASPASVTFTFRAPEPTQAPAPTQRPTETPVPAPATVRVPVYYRSDTGTLLYETSVTVARSTTAYVSVDTGLVPPSFTLISVSPVAVTANDRAEADPASVTFLFRAAAPTPAPAPTQAPWPTEAPLPTQAPEPTQPTQAPQPVGNGLTQMGDTVIFQGEALRLNWYQDIKGRPFISLLQFSRAADLNYQPGEEFYLLGKYCAANYTDRILNFLRVDGKDCSQDALIWRHDLFVGPKVFDVVGYTFTPNGDTLVIELKDF